MADILTLVFRTFVSRTDVTKDPRPAPLPPPPPPPAARSTLVVGERSVSRSVLLLAAVTAAAEMGMRVVFFTQTQIQSLPVSLQKYLPGLSPETLKKIKFCYPRTVEELLQQVASLHESANTCPAPPSLVVVDRLEGFLCGRHAGVHPGERTCAAHLSALLCDSAAFLTQLLTQRRPGSAPCRVMASIQPDGDGGGGEASATEPVLDVLDRYFQARCTLDRDGGYEAAAAGLQEVWHVYLSATRITEAPSAKDCEKEPGAAQEWRLLLWPDGLMEFKLA